MSLGLQAIPSCRNTRTIQSVPTQPDLKISCPMPSLKFTIESFPIHFQRNAFRALRFLFSMERNRRLFKRLFPPELYEMFIRCGHYVRDLNTYKPVVEKLNSLPVSWHVFLFAVWILLKSLDQFQESWDPWPNILTIWPRIPILQSSIS
jgi:hypothetical protein